jgi:hypothetical protein
MYKPNSLRAHLMGAIEELKRNPDKLLIFADEGNVVSRHCRTLSFEYAYKLSVIITDYAGAADAIIVPLLAWVAVHQVDLMEHDEKRKNGIRLQIDFNNISTIDLEVSLDLTEKVIVTEQEPGQLDAQHKGEPQIDDGAFVGDSDKIWTLRTGSQILAQWKTPSPAP